MAMKQNLVLFFVHFYLLFMNMSTKKNPQLSILEFILELNLSDHDPWTETWVSPKFHVPTRKLFHDAFMVTE